MQFYAVRDIKAGEQLFYSYCRPTNLAQRKAELAPYDFICQCPACLNATPETDELRDTFTSRIAPLKSLIENASFDEATLTEAIKLEKEMVKEGLDVEFEFVTLLTAICLMCGKLGRLEESEKYGVLVESFNNCFKSDE